MKGRTRHRVRRWVAILGLALTLVLAFALAAMLVLTFTTAGLRATDNLVRRVLPGELAMGAVTGTLAGPLHIRDLIWQNDALSVQVANAELVWHIERGALELALTADTIAITTRTQPAQHPAKTLTLPTISLPLPLRRARFQLRDIRINGSAPALNVEGAVAMAGSRLQIETLTAMADKQRVQASGWLETRGDYELDLQLQQNLVYAPAAGEAQTVTGTGHVSGSLAHLQIDQQVAGAVRAQLIGEVFDVLGTLRWHAEGALEPTPLAPLAPALAPLVANGKFSASGTTATLSATTSYQLDGLSRRNEAGVDIPLGAIAGKLDATLAARVLTLTTLAIDHADSGTRIDASGSFDLDSRALALTAHWRGERIPRGGAQDALPLATAGEISGRGTLDSYRFDGQGKLTLPGYPATTVTLSGSGTPQGLMLASARLATRNSRAEAQGTLAWAPNLRGDLTLKLSDLDPSLLLPAWPGKLSGAASLSGTIADGHRSATLAVPRIAGTLRGFAVAAAGTAKIADEAIEIDNVTVNSGRSRVAVSGVINREWDLKLGIHSPNLAELLPAAGGSLSGDAQLSGPRAHPRAVVEVAAAALRYADAQTSYRVDSLKLAANLDTDTTGKLDLKATARGLHRVARAAADGAANANTGQQRQRLEVGVAGTRAQHQLRVRAQNDASTISISARGGLDAAWLWTGELADLELTQAAVGTWRLRAPAPLIAGRARVELHQLCLAATAASGSLCAEGTWRDGNWAGMLDIAALPFALFAPLLRDDLAVTGTLSGRAEAAGAAAGIASGHGKLTTSAGAVQIGKGAEPIHFEPGSANFALDSNGVNAAFDVRLGAAGGIQARVALPGWRSKPGSAPAYDPQQPLTGAAHINLTALSVMNAIDSDVAHITGALNADLQLAGTLGAPKLSGQTALTDGSIEIAELGIRLRDIQLALVAAADGNVGIQGALRSGDGTLQITGNLQVDPAAGWPLDLSLTGTDLLVVDTPEATATASPQLKLKTTRERVELTGEIRIPRTKLTPRKIPAGAVKVSRDATIVSRATPARTAPDQPLPIHAQLRIILGDRVQFDGLGLRGRIDGELVVVDTPDQPTRGRGALSIHDGFYDAYGQNLAISQGRLLFAGPVDNPGLDIRAARTVGAVTAGINASGTLHEPKVELFSTPAMADADALAYLLLGRPLKQASGGDGNMLMAAATSMGLGKGDDIAKSIGRSLGLDEVRVDSSSDTGEMSLVVGRYLTPRLYARYLAGAFGKTGSLQLRYQLRPNLELQTESGEKAGSDIFYTIER